MKDEVDQPEYGRVVESSRKNRPYENLVNEVWYFVIITYPSPTKKTNLVVVLKTNYIFMTNGSIRHISIKFKFKIDPTVTISVSRLVLYPGTMRIFVPSL